jgi:tRNA(Arg) A34 adenosine deaminase TadA
MFEGLTLLIVIGGLALYAAHPRLHRLKGKVALTEEQRARLLELAGLSLQTADVPVGALLIYQGKVIGEGYNTVLRHQKAGEHAEVNAISAAIAALGMDEFSSLNRSELVLISTFEPCLMCGGACVNYNIQNVFFLKEKDFSYTGREEALFVRYLLRRRQIKNNREQETLFEKHPYYPGRRE